MTTVKNTLTFPLPIPGGPTLQPGTAREVPRWDILRRNNIVAAWLRAGALVAVPDIEQPEPTAPEVSDEPIPDAPMGHVHVAIDMAGLREDAKALGIDVNRRWGEKRLRAEIAKASA